MGVDSNSTRGRSDRLQLSVLLDASTVVSVRSAARARGMTIAALVERALEVELDGYVGVGPGGGARFADAGDGSGQAGGRDRVDDPVVPAVGRRVADWDSILTRGAAAKPAPSPDSEALVRVGRDPIEEIA